MREQNKRMKKWKKVKAGGSNMSRVRGFITLNRAKSTWKE